MGTTVYKHKVNISNPCDSSMKQSMSMLQYYARTLMGNFDGIKAIKNFDGYFD